ncbi:hypothetical protein COT97_02720 [Candidatus Falkowbacteria bacterium CG10_big_fil_rev_8_21_14_0_10_39_11]|uniref:Uncharacterized protein n=1 Tax=Candidatus Falkowbacteria bacterium CG10_big_fil_rev_8_21_14_0_10_39_11 TaxID=1974565 RepID=A0A2H0V4Z4_9BACT|nr:MAG: hypothetical protein COT97_02720 [Candidatus Falkowbacteria bacterium CG10_big_fil_rev_8_21_14_0_10_39_11]
MNKTSFIGTYPPLVDHRGLLVRDESIDELRYNTIMPIGETPEELLIRLCTEAKGKKIWLDLKCRQLRVTEFAYQPFEFVTLNHPIQIDTPFILHAKFGQVGVHQVVDGRKLILSARPVELFGAGQPVNILDKSLKIKGFLTDQDRVFIAVAKTIGIHSYMLSFVEQEQDIVDILTLDPDAEIIAKIESRRGLQFVDEYYYKYVGRVRLMAACDDLYVNMRPDNLDILTALKQIIAADPTAIAASRILTSLETSDQLAMQDIMHLELLKQMGFVNFMLSDRLCFNQESCLEALMWLRRIKEIWNE